MYQSITSGTIDPTYICYYTHQQMNLKTALTGLKIASLITILTGFICLIAAHPALQFPWLWLTDLIFWPLDGYPHHFKDETLILNAVLGGVMMGWGSLMYMLIPELVQNRGLRNKLFISLLIWFVFDSTASCFANAPGNIVLNILFLTLFIVPLSMLKKLG